MARLTKAMQSLIATMKLTRNDVCVTHHYSHVTRPNDRRMRINYKQPHVDTDFNVYIDFSGTKELTLETGSWLSSSKFKKADRVLKDTSFDGIVAFIERFEKMMQEQKDHEAKKRENIEAGVEKRLKTKANKVDTRKQELAKQYKVTVKKVETIYATVEKYRRPAGCQTASGIRLKDVDALVEDILKLQKAG